jgi:SAM-dependent methyltransferase
MADIEHLPDVFFELHRDLPREGPGDDESTLRALAMCTELPAKPDVLDVGCGPGMQTLALARVTGGIVTAVDMHEPFLDQLREGAEAAGVRERIHVMRGDMTDLPFGPDSFDLVWSEGAAYIMGITEAFTAWRRFLRPGGYIVVSELTWLVPDPPAEVYDLFTAQYAGIRDVAGNLERIGEAGYDVVGHFTLPDESWWTHYQTPLDARIPALLEKYAGDEAALAVINESVEEHRIRRQYPETYGYEFYVARCHGAEGPQAGSSWEPAHGGQVVLSGESSEAGDTGGSSEATAEADQAGQADRPDRADRPEFPPPLD